MPAIRYITRNGQRIELAENEPKVNYACDGCAGPLDGGNYSTFPVDFTDARGEGMIRLAYFHPEHAAAAVLEVARQLIAKPAQS